VYIYAIVNIYPPRFHTIDTAQLGWYTSSTYFFWSFHFHVGCVGKQTSWSITVMLRCHLITYWNLPQRSAGTYKTSSYWLRDRHFCSLNEQWETEGHAHATILAILARTHYTCLCYLTMPWITYTAPAPEWAINLFCTILRDFQLSPKLSTQHFWACCNLKGAYKVKQLLFFSTFRFPSLKNQVFIL
jgi:hypothetical protein